MLYVLTKIMDLEKDTPLSTPIKTPKKLQLICAEAIAIHLATKSVITTELYFRDPITPDINSHINSNTSPDVLLKDLLALKNWYWKETESWLGPSISNLRALISGSFQDILIYIASPTLRRERQVFNAFICQLLFSHCTGSYPTKCCYSVTHLTKDLDTFLCRLGPFKLLSIHDSCLMFGVANPYPVILKNSPSLKHIFISSNLSFVVLKSLRKYCKNIEVIEMEINDIEPLEKVKSLLCRTFFDGINMNELLEKANAGEDVQRSFPKLREIDFHSFRDYISIPCTLIYLLQHFNLGIQMTWRNKIHKRENISSCLSFARHCPPFAIGRRFHLDKMKVKMYVGGKVKNVPFAPSFFKTNYIDIVDDHSDRYYNLAIDELMKKYECNNLVLRFFRPNDNPVTESLYRIGRDLNELYLDTILYDVDQYWGFMRIISTCINLKVLSLEVKLQLYPDCECEEFDFQLLNLVSLCFGVSYGDYKRHITTKIWVPRESQSSCGDADVKTTTRLETLNDASNTNNPCTSISPGENGSMSGFSNALHQQCIESRSRQGHSNDQCTSGGVSHENEFSTWDKKLVETSDIIEEKMCRTSPVRSGRSNTPEWENISVQNHNLYFVYPQLKKGVRISKAKLHSSGPKDLSFIFSEKRGFHIKPSEGTFRYGQFGFGFYGNGSQGVGYYGYGVDGFGFYGHGEHGYGFYGYGGSGFGFYGSRDSTFNPEFHGNGKFGYSCYSNNLLRGFVYYNNGNLGYEYYPKLDSREKSRNNPFYPSTQHELELKKKEFTEHEDLGYGDPPAGDMITRLLLLMVSKCPNIKTLELQGMRLKDLIWLSHRGFLSRVCTLKISNTFSLEVKRILEDMPSLSLLIIDGLNGMSNFNKYKEFYRRTDLRVEFYDLSLVQPRSSTLDFDKTRLKL